jgi:putative drug exporter of the RND superfamily
LFERLGHLVVRRRAAILVSSILLTIISGVVGVQAFSQLSSAGYSDPGSDSAAALTYLKENFVARNPAILLVVDAKESVDNPAVAGRALDLERAVSAEQGVESTLSYWSAGGASPLRSADGKAAYIFVYASGDNFERSSDLGGRIQDRYDGDFNGLRVYASGIAVFSHAANERIKIDLARSEAIAVPLTLILLVIVFGAFAAAFMPLVVGLAAIAGSFMILWLVTLTTDVSVFALNLITGLGLGLGIDYSLLVVNRFREEMQKGHSVEEAVVRTITTAGRTVFFSGMIVAVTLASLVAFPQFFLRSFAYAGVAVVMLAVIGAIVPLGALLALLGDRVNAGTVRRRAIAPPVDGRWAQVSRYVMRHPVSVVIFSLGVLFILASPIRGVDFSQVDERVLPAKDRVAVAASVIQDRFPGREASPVEIVIVDGASGGEVSAYSRRLLAVDQVLRVTPPERADGHVRIQLISSADPRSPEGERLINDVRAVSAPPGTLVGGIAADYTDSQNAIARTLPFSLVFIAISVLILLFLFTGSILLPIKALVLNVLSLSATLGVLTWIFIDGNLKWLVGEFTVTGTLDTSTMVLIAVVAFGLSMDYEVFLLSRIKEEHDKGASNVEAVAMGLQKSARIITAAALILATVFAAFLISGVTSIKMMGIGVAFAIILDATLVRALLVPALMRLFGSWNWWAPARMKRFTVTH